MIPSLLPISMFLENHLTSLNRTYSIYKMGRVPTGLTTLLSYQVTIPPEVPLR